MMPPTIKQKLNKKRNQKPNQKFNIPKYNLNTILKQFRRPFVRDLAYALCCPDALKEWISPNPHLVSPKILVHKASFWHEQFNNYSARLHELDEGDGYKLLTNFLMARPSPYRLGFHFEGLIHFWLEDGYRLGLHPYQVLASNVQLYRDKQTTGELDFILHNHATNSVEHWELAIKFYLGSAPYKFKNWVGINSRDDLQRKLIHMQTKPFRSVWVDIDYYEKVKIDKRFVVLKGRFFRPSSQHLNSQTSQPFIKPDWLNDTFPMHKWYALNNAEQFNNLALPNLRPAHYIEWLTHRPFLDADFWVNNKAKHLKSNRRESLLHKNCLNRLSYKDLTFADLKTNLYFSDSEPVVLLVNK